MTLKVTETTATDSETSASLDLGLEALPKLLQRKIKRDVGDFLVESVLDQVGSSRSPVTGEDWPKLSRDYKKRKLEEGAPGVPNMDLHGDLLEALDFKETPDGIKIGFFGDQALKADGHLKFSGKDGTAPRRRSLPGEGQHFKRAIEDGAQKIIDEAVASEIAPSEDLFQGIETAAAFWRAAKETFPEASKAEIALLILENDDLKSFFSRMKLLRFIQ